MKKTIALNGLLLIGGIIYCFGFFRMEPVPGLLLTILASSILIIYSPKDPIDHLFLILFLLGAIITAVLDIVCPSFLCKLVHILSFLLLVGYRQLRVIRFLWYFSLLNLKIKKNKVL